MLVAAAATVVAAALTLYEIGDKSLWYDEAFTVGLVDRPFGDALWRITHWELNQSPYYVAMLGWHSLGDSEAFLRLLSAVFAVATVPLTFVLGRRLADPWVGAVAAAVVAGHGLVVEWGQQLRGYSMAMFLVVLATLLLVRAVDRPSTAPAVAYAVVASAAVYTHIFAVLVVAAHGVALLALRPIPWRTVRVAASTGGVLLAPMGWYMLTRDGDPLYWIGEPTPRQLAGTFGDLAGSSIPQLVVLGSLAALAVGAAVRTVRRRVGTVAAWHAALPVAWLAVPVAVAVVSTYTVKPLLVSRFLIIVVPALAILVAIGVRRLPAAGRAVAVAALVVVSAMGVQDWYDEPSAEDWRGVGTSLLATVQPGDDLMVVPGRAVHAVRYYAPGLPTVSPESFEQATADRLWLVERYTPGGTARPVPFGFPEWLEANYELVERQRFTELEVALYVRR